MVVDVGAPPCSAGEKVAAPVAALEADEVSLVAVNAWAVPVRVGDEMQQSWQPRTQLRHP